MNADFLLRCFLSGVVLGSTSCLLGCCAVLFPLVARDAGHWKEGVRLGALFGAGRMVVYALLGALAGFSHRLLKGAVENPVFAVTAGITIISVGVWFFLYPGRCCGGSRGSSSLPLFALGILYGLAPCAPLTGFLFYLAYVGTGVFAGAVSGVLFGLGTLASPILILCGIFPEIAGRISSKPGTRLALRLIGTLVFVGWGAHVLFRGLS